ncbi:MAG: class I SAM-dependent methyltransferase [Acidobacteriota bacterium]|nr:class I SAM-dependent methyltransferase [Acidobacteriota bacterium]
MSVAEVSELPAALSRKTRRVYDALSALYPLSTMLFHSEAHRQALALSGIQDGMRILEVATGSGEMFQRLVCANRSGRTVGVDLSPKMAARTQRTARLNYPGSRADCQAVDARAMPFQDGAFDAVVCCYLLELLPSEDIESTVAEFRRVLRRNGRLTLILIGQHAPFFNSMYQVCTRVAPAFWGRQVEERLPAMIQAHQFEILRDEKVQQIFYPSRVLIARK